LPIPPDRARAIPKKWRLSHEFRPPLIPLDPVPGSPESPFLVRASPESDTFRPREVISCSAGVSPAFLASGGHGGRGGHSGQLRRTPRSSCGLCPPLAGVDSSRSFVNVELSAPSVASLF